MTAALSLDHPSMRLTLRLRQMCRVPVSLELRCSHADRLPLALNKHFPSYSRCISPTHIGIDQTIYPPVPPPCPSPAPLISLSSLGALLFMPPPLETNLSCPLIYFDFHSKVLPLCLSEGMHLCWPSSTVEPASLQASWCSQCWASWQQSRGWTSVR